MLSARGLVVGYGAIKSVLDHVDLEVPDESVVAVLGSNGAGKSTLLRTISGTLGMHGGTLYEGTVELDGEALHTLPPASVARAGVVQSPEGRQVFGRMTVDENLRVGAMYTPRERRAAARDRVMDLFPPLADRTAQRGGLLSGGEQQMLAIGRAMMAEPRVLLLDEPSLGLAPKLIDQIGEIVSTINAQGTPVILVEQNAAMALRVSHRATVLEVGKVAMSGEARELAESDEISELYLGGHSHHHEEGEAPGAEEPARDRPRLERWTG